MTKPELMQKKKKKQTLNFFFHVHDYMAYNLQNQILKDVIEN